MVGKAVQSLLLWFIHGGWVHNAPVNLGRWQRRVSIGWWKAGSESWLMGLLALRAAGAKAAGQAPLRAQLAACAALLQAALQLRR